LHQGQLTAAREADACLVIVTPDVPAVRGARAVLERLEGPAEVVLRATDRATLRPRDVGAALGAPIAATIRTERKIARAVDLGRVPADRSIARLAARLARRWR
jgi:septum formation inhibitor-activating ATPase MinD